MNENNPEIEKEKSTDKPKRNKKIKAPETNLRVFLKGEAAERVKKMAERASEASGYTVAEGLIVASALDFEKADKWLETFISFMRDPSQFKG